jgi:hypothetical protein
MFRPTTLLRSQPAKAAFLAALLAFTALCFAGCGAGAASSGSGSSSGQKQAVVIFTQPASQAVPIGRAATFQVGAYASGTIHYQWSENGSTIPGATTNSYTTPTVSATDSGSKFQVTVSNSFSSSTSNVATLTAGPRAPAIGDLRYLLADQVTVAGYGNAGAQSGNVSAGWESISNAVGTPLLLSPCSPGTPCAWHFSALFLPPPMTGLTMWYKGGNLSDFNSDLQSSIAPSDPQPIIAPNIVITSLDFEPASDFYGISWVQATQDTGFDYRMQVVPLSQVSATVTQDGAASRVVTAVTIGAQGNAHLISYGWQGDTTTVFQTQTALEPPQNVATTAEQMAAQGYVISAFGGDNTNGYILVGMRVQGDILPRQLAVTTPAGFTPAPDPDTGNFTDVLWFDEPAGDPAAGVTTIEEQ